MLCLIRELIHEITDDWLMSIASIKLLAMNNESIGYKLVDLLTHRVRDDMCLAAGAHSGMTNYFR
jgi:hypothetical protein